MQDISFNKISGIFIKKSNSFQKENKYAIIALLALAFSYLIIKSSFIIVFILLLVFYYCFLLSWRNRFIIFSIIVFVPFCFLHIGPVQEFKWIEILAPLLSLLFIIEILLKKQQLFSKKSMLFFIAIAILFLWLIVNYIKNPVSAEKLFGASSIEGGLRSYYTSFIGITTFLCSFWFFKYKKIDINKWLFFLLIFSLSIGFLRLFSYFNNFYIPLLGGGFRFEEHATSYHRIGGLSEMAILGISIILSLIYKERKDIYLLILFLFNIILLYFSGGRAAFFGVILSISVYIILIKRKYLFSYLLILSLIFLFANLFNIYLSPGGQINRLIAIQGGFAKQDLGRYYTFQYYWEIFKQYPIFGKGFGYLQYMNTPSTLYQEFISKQIWEGGHNSYLSILSIFGAGGIIYLFLMLFGSIYYSYNIFRKDLCFKTNNNIRKLALFAFLYLIILSIVFIAGGAGYNSMELWFLSGIIAGINAKEESKINVKYK